MREQYMRSSEGFLIGYSIISRSSFDSLTSFRDQLVRIKGADVPIILLGGKCDLAAHREVSIEEAQRLAKKWNCPYFEVSPRLRINCDEPFYEMVRLIRKYRMNIKPALQPKKTFIRRLKQYF